MYERLFDKEYREHCIKRRANARLMAQSDPLMSVEQLTALRALPTYTEFVEQYDPANWYDPWVMEQRRQALLEKGQARRQAVLEREDARRRDA